MGYITQKFVENSVLPAGRQQTIVRDSELTGFGLRLTPGGKVYVVEARVNGKSRRITLGRADLFSADEARREAKKLLAQMTTGIDPQAESQKQSLSQITLGEVLDQYLTERRLRPSTAFGYSKRMKLAFRDWFGLPLIEITTA